jgi:hypothetical protein
MAGFSPWMVRPCRVCGWECDGWWGFRAFCFLKWGFRTGDVVVDPDGDSDAGARERVGGGSGEADAWTELGRSMPRTTCAAGSG